MYLNLELFQKQENLFSTQFRWCHSCVFLAGIHKKPMDTGYFRAENSDMIEAPNRDYVLLRNLFNFCRRKLPCLLF